VKAPTQQMMKTQLQGMLLELNLHTMAQVLDDQLSDPLYQEFSKLEFVHRMVEEEYVQGTMSAPPSCSKGPAYGRHRPTWQR